MPNWLINLVLVVGGIGAGLVVIVLREIARHFGGLGA